MRDLLFRNLTSLGKNRRRLSLIENIDRNGVIAKSQRHVIYSIKEVPNTNTILEKPTLSVIKIHNSEKNLDRLFCKMKGSLFAMYNQKIYLISFVHTLRINLSNSLLEKEQN